MSGLALGLPRLHLRQTDSTNARAAILAAAGAPHGALVTAAAQTAGRGRQGRRWEAPSGQALLASLVLRRPPHLLPLGAAVAVSAVVDRVAGGGDGGIAGGQPPRSAAQIKWPNDVLLEARKVAGILVEGRPQDGWAVLGIGLNVALRPHDLSEPVATRAGTLGLRPADVEAVLARLLIELERWLAASPEEVLGAWRARDALRGRHVQWGSGRGRALGVDGEGRLVVGLADGGQTELESGEVHLVSDASQGPGTPSTG